MARIGLFAVIRARPSDAGGAGTGDAGRPRVTVIVNGDPVEVDTWSCWRDAVAVWRPAAGAALAAGDAVLLDAGRQPIDPAGAVVPKARVTYCRTADV
ncbi:MAG TPA: hypothetical protein VM737_00955 [Gemmatimonadota bacterium]|nr:hypothetical protein [Gemmatimonadota bacterium]